MSDIKADPLDLLLRIQQAQSGEDYGTGMFSTPRGVGFSVGKERLILPMSSINEIVTCEELTPVPLTRPWVLGVANVRSNVITVIDLPGYMGMPVRAVRSSFRMIVINARGFRTALKVTDILGLRQLPEQDSDVTMDTFSTAIRPYVKRAFTLSATDVAGAETSGGKVDSDDSVVWGEFDLQALTASDEFINVGSAAAA